MAVLFCLLLAGCASVPSPDAHTSRITWKEDYSLKDGESASMRIFAIEDGKERRIVAGTCRAGCGGTGQTNAVPGIYRIEIENSKRPGIASALFTVRNNQMWVWDIANADWVPSFSPERADIETKQAGAYRIDLFAVLTLDMNADIPPMRHKDIKRIPTHFPNGHPEARQ